MWSSGKIAAEPLPELHARQLIEPFVGAGETVLELVGGGFGDAMNPGASVEFSVDGAVFPARI